jgi:hypothetical protein
VGLFSDLFGSSSHSQTTSSTSQVTNTQLSGGPLSGTVAYGTGNVINAVDQGTVKAATDISDHALALGGAELQTGAAVAIAGLNHASDAYTSSLTLVGDVTHDSIAGISGATGKALDSIDRFASSALDANTFIAGKSLDALSQSYSDSLTSVANANAGALTTVEGLASQVSQSSQQTTDQTVTRIVFALALAVAAIMIYRK